MYRAITLYFLRNHINWEDEQTVINALKNISLEFHSKSDNGNTEIFLNDENVEYLIRDLVIAEKVSAVASMKQVRSFAVKEQQKMGKNKGIVMDGRDIGTTVFPKAEVKLFMTAEEQIRVERRYRELYEKNPNISISEVKTNLELRDYLDSHREISPLVQAKDATVIDNSNLTEKEQFELAMKIIKKKLS